MFIIFKDKMSFTDLPLLTDLLKEHTCKKPIDGSPCTCGRVSPKESKPVSDRRLRRWEEWMEIRKRVHQRLGKLLQREPGELVMNSTEELRRVKVEKLALDYTKIPEPDPQRGCPGFWKIPYALEEECGENDTYFAILSKEDKCEIPELEHVGSSKLIMEEKDVLPRIRNSRALWESSDYLQAKSTQLAYELNKIRPHKPELDDLFIAGVSMSKPTKIASPIHVSFEELENTDVVEKEFVSQPKESPSILSLSVNELKLSPSLETSGIRKVYILFECDLSTSRSVVTEYITLKNLGTVTLRFYWRRCEKVEYFKDIIPDKSSEIYFYFNKNEGIIIPGQVIQFPIWFKTLEPGTYNEQWEFYTKPRSMPLNFKLIIVLQASAEIGDLDEKMDNIRKQLNDNIRDRLIKESLFRVTSNIPYDKYKPTIYSYNKKEVFETINSKFDPLHRQPKYLYNKEVVRELQKFYKKVRRASDPKVWNYRIEELRLLAKSKQRKEDHSKWLAQQEIAKRIHDERPQFPTLPCPKNVYPDAEEVKQTPKDDISKHIEITRTETLINAKPLPEQLELILAKLECPATEKILDRDKFSQAYSILCTFFDKIGYEIEELQNRLGIIIKTKYPKFPSNYVAPLYYKPTRLSHERFYDILQGPPLTAKVGTRTDQPAAEALQAIPVEDTKRRYRTYYNLPDTPPPELNKGKKKGKGKDKKADKKKDKKADKKGDKKGKGGKSEAKPATVESDEEDGYVVDELFDPYAQVNLSKIEEQEPEEVQIEEKAQSNYDMVLPAVRRQYKYNMYIIMYNYLDKAISNIVDMIEMQPKENLPYAVIKELEEPKYNKRLIDLKSLLVEESAEQLKAKLLVYKYRKYSKTDWKTIEIQRQLKNVKSDTSLWSVFKPDEPKPKLPESKPISYPIDHYDSIPPSRQQTVKQYDEDQTEKPKTSEVDIEKPQLMVNISTSTLEGGVLDTTWEDFKDASIQKNYDEEEEPEDLVAFIEKIVSQTSIQELMDIKLDKATQKKSEEHISDEEHFYDSDPDMDTEAIELSVDSEQSEEDSCGCEGLGVCNLPVDEETCTCEGYGECNKPVLHEYGDMGKDEENEELYESSLTQHLASYSGLEKSNKSSTKDLHKCKECN